MHYCLLCDAPTAMEPRDGAAICPLCQRQDQTGRLRPLFVVTGASGSGKTTMLGPFASRWAGRCMVFDVDRLLDAAAVMSGADGIAGIHWQGFYQAWLSVAQGVAQCGLPTLLLGALVPDGHPKNPKRKWIGEIYSPVLDCPNRVRRQRIENRPPWRLRDITEQSPLVGGSENGTRCAVTPSVVPLGRKSPTTRRMY
jgi:hypothetical protein